MDEHPSLDLWRVKIDKGGRILFEVAAEYNETTHQWVEMIRIWTITLDHKMYEKMIDSVSESFRRSAQVREKRRLQLAASLPSRSSCNARFPKPFVSLNAEEEAQALQPMAGLRPIRNHLPPASPSLDTFTLLKFYNLGSAVLSSVFRGLMDADADFVFKVRFYGYRELMLIMAFNTLPLVFKVSPE